ncbi:MAG: hypothetical protein J4F31_05880 [Flavobacteriales bacterium]|nr:hypothetical protein [Flavobacteriales bacterium]
MNRSFIDLIGREPLDVEMDYYVDYLKINDSSFESRDSMIVVLMTDTQPRPEEGSYKEACHQRIYDLAKARFLEGVSDAQVQSEIGILAFALQIDSLNGDYAGSSETLRKMRKLQSVIDCRLDYQNDSIELDSVCARMIDNSIYDFINMNTFNFVNASFDNLFWRYLTEAEFRAGYDMIESNQSQIIFGGSGTNKEDYIDILVRQREFYEGNIVWAYTTLMARDPSTLELADMMNHFWYDHDFQRVQRKIIRTDDYAGF